MGLLDKIKEFAAGSTEKIGSNIINSVMDGVDRFITNPQEKIEFEKYKTEAAQKATDSLNQYALQVATIAQAELTERLKDTQSARDRETQIANSEKAPLINKIISPVLAIVTIGLTFTLFYIILFRTLGTEKDIIIYILGALTAVTGQIFSFYFGSSAGSKSKSDQIDKMINR